MKPARFDYHSPRTLGEGLSLLSELCEDNEVKLLAGGQSLIPLMNMRLSRPEHVIDLRRINELRELSVDDNSVRLGSMVTQRRAEKSVEIAFRNGLLCLAIKHIGHFQIRERGTVGGSISHADPSAELPLVAVVLGASMEIRDAVGGRELDASDFFVSFLTTALQENEMLTAVRFPTLPDGAGWGFREYARRRGDFALVGVAATLRVVDGRCVSGRLGVSGVAEVPVLIDGINDLIGGEKPSSRLWTEAARRAVANVTPLSDAHASAEDRRQLVEYLASRAMEEAATRAHSSPSYH